MASDPQRDDHPSTGSGAGPFVLRTLFPDVPLSEDGTRDDIKITCVEYLDRNLYIGTSDSELLHFFQIPADPADESGVPTFILASRLRPVFAESAGTSNATRPGVQQILLLPTVGKACILCNWTVTFYSLPELSPVFGSTQVKNCNWIGGIDLNAVGADSDRREEGASVTILLSLTRKIQVVAIDDSARPIKRIDFAGSTIYVRRDSIACVADSRGYALLEIERQLKIPLMSVSSLDEAQPGDILGQAQHISVSSGGLLRSNSSAQSRSHAAVPDPVAHRRGTSLGDFITAATRRPDHHGAEEDGSSSQQTTSTPPGELTGAETPPPLDAVAGGQANRAVPPARPQPGLLKPLIVSPTPEEFLLVTGTGPLEPGIGMFVNLDGDPTRPTVEFDRYPKEIVVDGGPTDVSSSPTSSSPDDEGYILASMGRDFPDGVHYGLEIQRWDLDVGEGEPTKYWLEPPDTSVSAVMPSQSLGIRSLRGTEKTHFPEIVDRLRQRRFVPFSSGITKAPSTMSLRSFDSRTALSVERVSKEKELFERDNDSQSEESLPDSWQATRNAEEEEFARRLAGSTTRLAVWSGKNIWWAMRNPLILQLDARLEAAASISQPSTKRRKLFTILNSFRGQDAKSELEFLTFNYIRQRVGLLLLTSFLKSEEAPFSEPELRATEEILVDSLLDPRVVLSLIPGVRNEVIETKRGIWIFGGVKSTAEEYISGGDFSEDSSLIGALSQPVLHFLRRFLTSWRGKKGFGSIPDENEVFRTVDAALLAVLLELDQHSTTGPAKAKSVRAGLYELVDNGVDCFNRAETLIESYHRLYVLSRLYQSRKMAAEVLATWRRIIEGERDDGGELTDGEQRVREYLTKVGNHALVQEYGIWLANRNPKLGVQIFAEDRSRGPKFDPSQVVQLLRDEAPEAVKYYLEFLVFGKGHTIYVNELITYYLDIVTSHLRTSAEAHEVMLATYAAYRALHPPKPTYRQFLTENAPADDEAWHSRLRLLQLLGGSYDYDSTAIRERLSGLDSAGEDLLVPETIILDGRERNHENALRLLVHRLGDYDTAVAYCLRGGASIYTIYQAPAQQPPPSGPASLKAPRRRDSTPPTQDEQARLFRALLGEFLELEDVGDRVEQTGLLLERFGGWFDVTDVLAAIPDSWSVDLVAGFLAKALRRLVAERNETAIARALSSAQNLRVQHDLIVRIDEKGPSIET
ncbi:hypothetical protein GGS23DRAFT_164166 [Durotheca rogersii]|uniref:uncharacterized protein n=1 Tax=Durotheca rogersii TaxID=419775 RepID=UPI002220F2C6|nr:uncharacterized protein GGS23DRAFT_164166 [Durotheca rogersii]KAI5867165.1 hypothetical protein GGS23DRAFT_164166 [Durotheca rogersii]